MGGPLGSFRRSDRKTVNFIGQYLEIVARTFNMCSLNSGIDTQKVGKPGDIEEAGNHISELFHLIRINFILKILHCLGRF